LSFSSLREGKKNRKLMKNKKRLENKEEKREDKKPRMDPNKEKMIKISGRRKWQKMIIE